MFKSLKGVPMSVFSKILEKLGLKKDKPAEAPAAMPPRPTGSAGTTAKPAAKPSAPVSSAPRPGVQTSAPPAAAPKPMSEVDVVKKLEALGSGKGLNWKVSIVDLLTLLEIDSSRESRNELAKELGCPPEFMNDSAKMNTWLHKTVLKKIAENGGNIPKELLD
jgi:hypothetical protein